MKKLLLFVFVILLFWSCSNTGNVNNLDNNIDNLSNLKNDTTEIQQKNDNTE